VAERREETADKAAEVPRRPGQPWAYAICSPIHHAEKTEYRDTGAGCHGRGPSAASDVKNLARQA